MKGIPEKLVMAAVILSCGLVAHSDPSAREHKEKHASASDLHTWSVIPGAPATAHPAKVARAAIAARAETP